MSKLAFEEKYSATESVGKIYDQSTERTDVSVKLTRSSYWFLICIAPHSFGFRSVAS